jgi:hypothetical protein
MITELLLLKGLLPDGTQQSIRVNGTTSGTAPSTGPQRVKEKVISGIKSFMKRYRN